MVILEKTNIEREECQHKFPIVHGHCVVGGCCECGISGKCITHKKIQIPSAGFLDASLFVSRSFNQ